jgi:hypothetical protein
LVLEPCASKNVDLASKRLGTHDLREEEASGRLKKWIATPI